MLEGSFLVGFCFGFVDVVLVYCLVEVFGGFYDILYGVVNVVFLLYVLWFNFMENK